MALPATVVPIDALASGEMYPDAYRHGIPATRSTARVRCTKS